jgi:cytochrome oxidase Cu insertion factor (SCO1/SenC/PrrC family)
MNAVRTAHPASVALPERGAAERFLTGTGLLVFLTTALVGYEAFLAVTIFGPTSGGWLGDFVRDFQLWCYRGDPRTGGVSWAAVSIMLLEPLFVFVVAGLLWRSTMAQLARTATWVRHWRAALAGLLLVAVCVAGLVVYARQASLRANTLPPFPGEAIRVKLPVPATALLDQKGRDFRFADLRGRVVLATGVYAACSTACPEIFKEMQALVAELTTAERAGLSLVALSLNPEYETAELMDLVAQARGLEHPGFRYVNTAQPAVMHDLLTRFQFSRTRDPRTGVIDHANLFLLIDRNGDIAYRFTLEPRHRAWLREALRALLREPHGAAPAS